MSSFARHRHKSTGLAVLLATLVGGVLGRLMAMDATGAVRLLPGEAWIADVEETRATLGTMLGIQITLVGVAVSLTVFIVQNAVSQYSPRLVSLMAARGPFRRALVLFGFSGAFTLIAVWQLGFLPDAGPAPRPVISGGAVLLLLAAGFVITEVYAALSRIQVEQILRTLAEATLAATARLERERGRLRLHAGALSGTATESAIPIPAWRTGYVVDIDLGRLQGVARRDRVRVRIDKTFGDDVVRGEPLGWILAEEGSTTARTVPSLADTLSIDTDRSLLFDVAYGLRVLADIADRALSPAVNDPYTARQSLHQMRAILLALAPLPLGPARILDEHGHARITVAFPTFRELLSLAVDGPSRYGAGDPDVIDGILDLAATVGHEVSTPDDRAAILRLIEHTLEDAAEIGRMDASRLEALRAKSATIVETLQRGKPRATAMLRPAWAVAAVPGGAAS